MRQRAMVLLRASEIHRDPHEKEAENDLRLELMGTTEHRFSIPQLCSLPTVVHQMSSLSERYTLRKKCEYAQ